MVAQLHVSDRLESNMLSAVVTRLFLAVSMAAVSMLLLLSLWLLARRIGGELQPLGAPLLGAVALVLAGLVSLARLVWLRHRWCPGRWTVWPLLRWAVPSVMVLMLAGALSIPGTGTTRILGFWTFLILVEGVWWTVAWRSMRDTSARESSLRDVEEATLPPAPSPIASPPLATAAEHAGREPEDDEEHLSEEISQQITRSCAEEENDTVTGLLRARFAPKERSRSLHVAFCPPMLHLPTVSLMQVAGPRARIKAAEVRAFGIRFDLRLSVASEEPEEAVIHFEARCGQAESGGVGQIRAGSYDEVR